MAKGETTKKLIEQEKKKAPTEMVPVSEMIKPVVSVEQAVSIFKQYQSLKEKLADKGDLVEIRGKLTPTKQFANKLAKFFGISVEILKAEKEYKIGPRGGKILIWKVWAKAIAPNHQFRVSGGACSSSERGFTHLEHDVYATAETRAKNRAIMELAGFGEVSAEEEESGGEKKIEEGTIKDEEIPIADEDLQ